MSPIVRFARLTAEGPGDEDEQLLTVAERQQRDRLRDPHDRAAFVASHVLVRKCAGELLGRPAHTVEIVQHCPDCDRHHGRPSVTGFPDLHVSLSRTRSHIAAAAAWSPIGVDVEPLRPLSPPTSVLTPHETAWLSALDDPAAGFIRLWVRKEALVKAGLGRLDRLRDLDVFSPPPRTRLSDWDDGAAVGACAVLLPAS